MSETEQETETDTCGVFQLYFYDDLFGPRYDSTIINHVNLTKNTVQTLLNELFLLDKEMNEKTLETFIVNKDIKFGKYKIKNLF